MLCLCFLCLRAEVLRVVVMHGRHPMVHWIHIDLLLRRAEVVNVCDRWTPMAVFLG